jgi:hypothetical protein
MCGENSEESQLMYIGEDEMGFVRSCDEKLV